MEFVVAGNNTTVLLNLGGINAGMENINPANPAITVTMIRGHLNSIKKSRTVVKLNSFPCFILSVTI